MNNQHSASTTTNPLPTPIIINAATKVWSNKVLRIEIFKHIDKFRIISKDYIKTISQLKIFKDKEYMSKLYLKEDEPIIRGTKDIPISLIPYSLRFLALKADIRLLPGHLSDGLSYLNLAWNVKEINFNVIPTSIRGLVFDNHNKVIIPNEFAIYHHLESLAIGTNSSELLKYKCKFPNLKRLVIDGCKEQPNELVIPNGLMHLVFATKYKKELPPIPQDIEYLTIHTNYRKQFSLSLLPRGLVWLTIRSLYVKFNLEDFKIFPYLKDLQFTNCSFNFDDPTAGTNLDSSQIIQVLPNISTLIVNNQIYERVDGIMKKVEKKKRKVTQDNYQENEQEEL